MAKSFFTYSITTGTNADRLALTSVATGMQFYETDTDKLYAYFGSNWYRVVAETYTGNVSITGNITATGDITSMSDAAMKENVRPIENALEIVNSLDGVHFNYKNNGEESLGLLAQNVQEHLPDAVLENEDGTLSLKYGNLVGLLVEAIKEQQKKINDLEDRLNGS